jgi:ATP-dependent helicase YprA (DUF1998 family)
LRILRFYEAIKRVIHADASTLTLKEELREEMELVENIYMGGTELAEEAASSRLNAIRRTKFNLWKRPMRLLNRDIQ